MNDELDVRPPVSSARTSVPVRVLEQACWRLEGRQPGGRRCLKRVSRCWNKDERRRRRRDGRGDRGGNGGGTRSGRGIETQARRRGRLRGWRAPWKEKARGTSLCVPRKIMLLRGANSPEYDGTSSTPEQAGLKAT